MVSPLKLLAKIHLEHTNKVIMLCFALTAFLALGIPQIQIQTSFQEGLPDDLPPIEAEEKVQSKFGNTESLIVLFRTDETVQEESYITDVRDPRMIRTLNFLEEELENEPLVESTNSMAGLFEENPDSKQEVKQRLSAGEASFTNRDFTATTMFVKLSEEMNEQNVREASDLINQNIDQTPKYPGLKISVTGQPAIRSALGEIIVSDSTRIIGIASVIILILLSIARGVVYGPATFIPLFTGLIWTLGAMGWIGLPLTIVTISLSSMLLGLGVEYGSFITERIVEEKADSDIESAIQETMPNTGRAVVGSSATDLIGFLALLLGSISFIRDLGLTLALGEALTVSAALVLTPALILKYERWKSKDDSERVEDK
jgi:predicted RND superfamily exporter protein